MIANRDEKYVFATHLAKAKVVLWNKQSPSVKVKFLRKNEPKTSKWSFS